jgi:signal transduction histidine kinase
MKLLPRLFLLGAVLPSLLTALVFFVVVRLFGHALETELDRALLAQAAVESVSLFDGPRGLHLHMSSSPLLKEVQQFAPEASVYDDDGVRLLAFPAESTALPERWPMPTLVAAAPSQATLTTTADQASRRLAVLVAAPRGSQRFLLVLSASRAHLLQTQTMLARLATGSVVLLLVVLSLVTFLQARRLSARVQRLIAHQARVSSGILEPPPHDDDGDELSSLRAAAAAATAELAASRASRERFLAEAAHELRTPLASMRVALELALRRAQRASTAASASTSPSTSPSTSAEAVVLELCAALKDARDETDRLGQLAQGLLDLSAARSAPISLTPTDVGALVERAVAARRHEGNERGLRLISAGDDVEASVHAPSVRRAVDNMIDNAIKHAAAQVSVTVTSSPRAIEIVVLDDGPGFPEDAVDAVFAPFHRLDHAGDGGVGLGLTLVREVAVRHGGEATAKPGPGGRVTLRLPRTTSSPGAQDLVPRADPMRPR